MGWNNNKRFYEDSEYGRGTNELREYFSGDLSEINNTYFIGANATDVTSNPALRTQDLGSYMNPGIDDVNTLIKNQASILQRLSNIEKNQQLLSNYAKTTRQNHLSLSNQALKNGDQISLLVSGQNTYNCPTDSCTGNNEAWQGKDSGNGFWKMWDDSMGTSYSSNGPSFPNGELSGYLHASASGSPMAWMDGNMNNGNFNSPATNSWSKFYMLKDWEGNAVDETAPDPFN